MKHKLIIFVVLLFANLNAFTQNKNSTNTNNSFTFELSVGKIFSPYRFYKKYKGYENISLGISKNIFNYSGIALTQSYGRIFSETINNSTLVMTTTINPYVVFFHSKKVNIKFSLGTGLLILHSKHISDTYPVSEYIYGMPVKFNIAFPYKLNNKLTVSFNLDSHYGVLFSGDNYLIINDPYYYKTLFYSTNIGVSYAF